MPPFEYKPFINPYIGSISELMGKGDEAKAAALIRIGEIQARAAEQQGQAWGNAIQGLGNIAGKAFTDYAQEKKDAPRIAAEQESRNLQNEAAKMSIASLKQAAEDKSILGSAQGSGLEFDAVKTQLQQKGRGDLIPIYEQTYANMETARLGLKTKRGEVQAMESDYFGALAAGVKKSDYDPMAVQWALDQADADGHDTKQIRMMLQKDINALKPVIDSLIEKSPTQRELFGKEADRTLNQARENRALLSAQQVEADRIADNKRADKAAEALASDREADNRRLIAESARAAGRDVEWVTRNGEVVQILKGAAQPGDVPYSAASMGMGAASIQTRNARAAAALNGIEKLITLAPKRTLGPLGIAEGAIEVGKGMVGYNTNVRQYQRLIQPVAMQMAVSIQGAANLSNNEREAMAKLLGSIGSMDYESQMALLENAKDLVKSGHDVTQVDGSWVPMHYRINVAPGAGSPQGDAGDDAARNSEANALIARTRAIAAAKAKGGR